jgi:DNA-binding NarL/FixJ family response regulator
VARIRHPSLSATFGPSDDRFLMTDPALHAPADTTPVPSPRLLVVDADDRTRESIVGILGIRHRYDVVGSAGHSAAALALMKEHRPDVVIIDPRLPELPDGIALIRRMRTINPGVRILAVGWTPSLEHDALEAGADVFVRKTFKPGDLSGAISRCMDAREDEPTAGLIL